MKIACPHCSFSREVPDGQVPDRPVKVTCPKCRQGFSFDKRAATAAAGFDADFGEIPAGSAASSSTPGTDRTVCPACGLEQPAGAACTGCGVIYAKWAARQETRGQSENASPPPRPEAVMPTGSAHAAASPADLPKAGFWIRVVACLLDSLLVGTVQFCIVLVLGLAGGALTGGDDGMAMGLVTWLCSTAVGLTYYIFFTGYNGQTPGKMALRIQVVRSDGTPMSYGRAFLREVPGKFLSAILLGIGYLMVAFDRNKQGLHDRIAGTYVIKL